MEVSFCRWPWLGGWADLRSLEGLQHLEEHFERMYGEQQLRERIREVEEEQDYGNDGVNSDVVFHGEDNVHLGEVELALSPLSSLSKNMDGLSLQSNVDNLDSSHADNANSNIILSSETEHQQQEVDNSIGSQVVQAVERFSGLVAPLLADRLPEVVGEQQAADWGQQLLPHWVGLRREVNNWRSDPAGRYVGVDFSRLAGKVVEGLVQGLELELGLVEMQRAVQLFNVLSNLPTNINEMVPVKDFMEGGFNVHRSNRVDRQESSNDWSKLKEVQGLASIAAQVYSSKTLPEAKTMLELWEVQRVSEALATKKVNKARRFLHSSTSSGGSTESETVRAVNLTLSEFAATGEAQDDLAKHGGEVHDNEEEGFLTPPSSVMSQGSSMETCDEGGGLLYLHGTHPTQVSYSLVR